MLNNFEDGHFLFLMLFKMSAPLTDFDWQIIIFNFILYNKLNIESLQPSQG